MSTQTSKQTKKRSNDNSSRLIHQLFYYWRTGTTNFMRWAKERCCFCQIGSHAMPYADYFPTDAQGWWQQKVISWDGQKSDVACFSFGTEPNVKQTNKIRCGFIKILIQLCQLLLYYSQGRWWQKVAFMSWAKEWCCFCLIRPRTQDQITNKQLKCELIYIFIRLCHTPTTLLQTHKDDDKRCFHEMGKRVTLLPSNGLPNLHLYLDPHMCAAAKPIWYTYNRVSHFYFRIFQHKRISTF